MLQSLWTMAVPYLCSPITWIVLIFGSIVGSFLNVCILRIPEGTFWKFQRSICPACEKGIPFYLNIPVLGWIFLRGKAKCCGVKISIQYPLVELLTAIGFATAYWLHPFLDISGGQTEIYWPDMIRFCHTAILLSLLIICSFIDFRLMIIPDVISLSMIAVVPLVVIIHPDLNWQDAIIGVIAGGGVLYTIAWIYWLIRREIGMGMGDVKLLAGIGGWLGYQAILPTIFLGSVMGALFGIGAAIVTRNISAKTAIPFGPFLAIGAIIHMMLGSYLQELLFSI